MYVTHSKVSFWFMNWYDFIQRHCQSWCFSKMDLGGPKVADQRILLNLGPSLAWPVGRLDHAGSGMIDHEMDEFFITFLPKCIVWAYTLRYWRTFAIYHSIQAVRIMSLFPWYLCICNEDDGNWAECWLMMGIEGTRPWRCLETWWEGRYEQLL